MTKRKVSKLFAVVALASAPAAADRGSVRTEAAHVVAARIDPWAAPVVRTAAVGEQPTALTRVVLAALGVSTPRVLPSGAPACGNVSAKSPRRAECEPKAGK